MNADGVCKTSELGKPTGYQTSSVYMALRRGFVSTTYLQY